MNTTATTLPLRTRSDPLSVMIHGHRHKLRGGGAPQTLPGGVAGFNSNGQPIGTTGGLVPMQRSDMEALETVLARDSQESGVRRGVSQQNVTTLQDVLPPSTSAARVTNAAQTTLPGRVPDSPPQETDLMKEVRAAGAEGFRPAGSNAIYRAEDRAEGGTRWSLTQDEVPPQTGMRPVTAGDVELLADIVMPLPTGRDAKGPLRLNTGPNRGEVSAEEMAVLDPFLRAALGVREIKAQFARDNQAGQAGRLAEGLAKDSRFQSPEERGLFVRQAEAKLGGKAEDLASLADQILTARRTPGGHATAEEAAASIPAGAKGQISQTGSGRFITQFQVPGSEAPAVQQVEIGGRQLFYHSASKRFFDAAGNPLTSGTGDSDTDIHRVLGQLGGANEANTNVTNQAGYASADEVRAAFRAGKLTRSDAEKLLREQFNLK